MILPLNGQRVDVLLNRGEADVWYAGTGKLGGIELDDQPPGLSSWAVEQDISDWRPRHAT